MKFRVMGHGRKVGAIGASSFFVKDLETNSEDSAKVEIYKHYEHISELTVVKASIIIEKYGNEAFQPE